ncbi:N-acetylmuramoyl-L-alanine amidase [Paenibacillus sp. DMB20]|uniref:N-acetylmuramoyl-L-alanine amidase n=1 Tax=Paenibacillus sp. DMB20 TaxID=1642570 RepID=UPI003FA6074A
MVTWTRLRNLSVISLAFLLAVHPDTAFAEPPLTLPETSAEMQIKPASDGKGASRLPGLHRDTSVSAHRHHPFPHEVILIDAGHGGIDGGTSYGDILEKDINLAISRRLFMLLRSKGYPAVLNRDADYALSDDNRWHASRSRHRRDLAQRKELSSEIPTKMVVSIHVNWGRNTSKRGGMVLHQSEGRSFLVAESIQQQLNKMYRSRHRTSVGKPFLSPEPYPGSGRYCGERISKQCLGPGKTVQPQRPSRDFGSHCRRYYGLFNRLLSQNPGKKRRFPVHLGKRLFFSSTAPGLGAQ